MLLDYTTHRRRDGGKSMYQTEVFDTSTGETVHMTQCYAEPQHAENIALLHIVGKQDFAFAEHNKALYKIQLLCEIQERFEELGEHNFNLANRIIHLLNEVNV